MFKKTINYLVDNLNGTFSWEKYSTSDKVDPKFGANQVDYLGQMPIIGILFWMIILYIICVFHLLSFTWLTYCDTFEKISNLIKR